LLIARCVTFVAVGFHVAVTYVCYAFIYVVRCCCHVLLIAVYVYVRCYVVRWIAFHVVRWILVTFTFTFALRYVAFVYVCCCLLRLPLLFTFVVVVDLRCRYLRCRCTRCCTFTLPRCCLIVVTLIVRCYVTFTLILLRCYVTLLLPGYVTRCCLIYVVVRYVVVVVVNVVALLLILRCLLLFDLVTFVRCVGCVLVWLRYTHTPVVHVGYVHLHTAPLDLRLRTVVTVTHVCCVRYGWLVTLPFDLVVVRLRLLRAFTLGYAIYVYVAGLRLGLVVAVPGCHTFGCSLVTFTFIRCCCVVWLDLVAVTLLLRWLDCGYVAVTTLLVTRWLRLFVYTTFTRCVGYVVTLLLRLRVAVTFGLPHVWFAGWLFTVCCWLITVTLYFVVRLRCVYAFTLHVTFTLRLVTFVCVYVWLLRVLPGCWLRCCVWLLRSGWLVGFLARCYVPVGYVYVVYVYTVVTVVRLRLFTLLRLRCFTFPFTLPYV